MEESHRVELRRPSTLGRLRWSGSGACARRGLRASLTFRVPTDLTPGVYYILICGDPCAVDPGANPWPPLYIGVDPPSGEGRVHNLPRDDPAIDLLPDDALIFGADGDTMTVAAFRAEVANDAVRSERVKTATAPADEHRDDHTRLTLWTVAVGLVLGIGWIVSRWAAPRKRIRPGP